MKALLDNPRPCTVHAREYVLGEIPSDRGGVHQIVLALAAEGENSAAIRSTLLLSAFPSLTDLIMVGIAGGIPFPSKPDRHVRLGDIVVSGEGGVVQYDFVTDLGRSVTPRHPPRPPSARLLEAVRLLEAEEFGGARPWLAFIDQALARLESKRPASTSDVLLDSVTPTRKVSHPADPDRKSGRPRVFRGTIASANRLLKNPKTRDKIRDKFGVRAVEMEASGIADATWESSSGYLVVRGICDYCDSSKGDAWQKYAAAAAAGYARALVASMPVRPDPRTSTAADQAVASQAGVQAASGQTETEMDQPGLLLRDFAYYGTDPYHPPAEGPYYPPGLAAAPSAAVSFTISNASDKPFRLQNVYLNVVDVEPLDRATFPVYERGNGAVPILSWVELGRVPALCRIMTERRSKVGSQLDPSDFHVRVFSPSGGRYRIRVEADWIDMEHQDRVGRFVFPDVFPLDIARLVTWESLLRGAKEVRAFFDSSAPFLAEALSALQPRPEFKILSFSTFEEERDWIRRGAHCYVVRPGEEQALTALTGTHQHPYQQGPVQFLLVDSRLLLLQEGDRIDEAKVVQDAAQIADVTSAFDELAQRVMTSYS